MTHRYSKCALVLLGCFVALRAIPSPAEAQSRRALGIVGAAAVGAIILNEVDRAQRREPRRQPQARRQAPADNATRQAKRDPAGQAPSTQTAQRGVDPFAGVAPTRATKSGD
jgi:hypothetical protein